jgi:hypothetical protein
MHAFKSIALPVLFAAVMGATCHAQSDSLRARFASDTIYYASIDGAHRRIAFAYGAYPLVAVSVAPDDSADWNDFVAAFTERTRAWQSVRDRVLWDGTAHVPENVVDVVSKVTRATREHIQRIQPWRFQIELSGNLTLRIAVADSTGDGAALNERMHNAWRWLGAFGSHRAVDCTVSAQDAQTLYYALEPGTPVVLLNRRE